MKIIDYVGIEGSAITIEKPTDLYPALDWIQSRMMDFVNDGKDPDGRFADCANFIHGLLTKTEEMGFGDVDEVDNINYG